MKATSTKTEEQKKPPRCYILSLAPKLLIAIAKDLDYYDLKHFASSCKKMEELIKSPEFDPVLFRGSPCEPPDDPATLDDPEVVTLHPVLELIDNLIINDPAEATICSAHVPYKIFRCIDLVACDENATCPAVDTLCVEVSAIEKSELGQIVSESEDKGVTVRQVIMRIVTAWNSTGEHGWRRTHFDMVAHRHHWEGLAKPRLSKVGVLTLYSEDTEYDRYPAYLDHGYRRRYHDDGSY